MDYFLHSLKRITSLNELEKYFDKQGNVLMPPDYVKKIINNPLLRIYHHFFFKKPYRAVQNHNLAESIFNIAQVEYLKNKKNKQARDLVYRSAEFCIKSLQKDGSYDHNEHDHEDQFALHEAAMCTLINAYNLFGEKKFLDAAKKGGDFLLRSRFEKLIDGNVAYWFPHDTLELASKKNEFVLNTHMYTVAVLCLLYNYTKSKKYLEAAKKGLNYFMYLTKQVDKNKYKHFDNYLVRKPILLGFLPTILSASDFKKMARFPSFQTKSGFLKRALHQPGPHYHFCNWLYLEMVYQYLPFDEHILDKAIEYAIFLLKKGFKNKLYIHSDWYFNAALMLACRRNSKFKKYKKYQRTEIGLDPRQFQTLEPVTPLALQKKKPTDFYK